MHVDEISLKEDNLYVQRANEKIEDIANSSTLNQYYNIYKQLANNPQRSTTVEIIDKDDKSKMI